MPADEYYPPDGVAQAYAQQDFGAPTLPAGGTFSISGDAPEEIMSTRIASHDEFQ